MPAFVTPYTYVPDPTGDRAMFLGEAFFGMPNTDPTIPANQITVRKVEEDGSFTDLQQPIQIGLGGVVEVDGSPAQLDIVENNYAVLIRDRDDVQRFSFASAGPGGATGREVLISQGGLPFDPTVTTTGPSLVINPLIHTNALILVDTSAGDVTLNLPSATLTGDKFRFACKKTTPDGNAIIIDPAGADRIDLQATLRVQEQHECLEILTDGTDRWWSVASFLRSLGLRLRTVETTSTANQTNVSTNAANIAELEGLPRVYAAARTGSAGTASYANNLTVTRTATGQYTYLFVTPIPTGVAGDFVVLATPASNRIYSVSNISETGFRLNFNIIQQPSGDTPSDVGHHVTVIADSAVFAAG